MKLLLLLFSMCALSCSSANSDGWVRLIAVVVDYQSGERVYVEVENQQSLSPYIMFILVRYSKEAKYVNDEIWVRHALNNDQGLVANYVTKALGLKLSLEQD